MATYDYSISLRIWDKVIRPEAISNALGIEPSRTWLIGEARSTPKGRPLSGFYEETFWTARLLDSEHDKQPLFEAISHCLAQLEARKEFFLMLSDGGGGAELFVGWFFNDGNSGDVLPHELMARLADLRLNLSFDIYPDAPDP